MQLFFLFFVLPLISNVHKEELNETKRNIGSRPEDPLQPIKYNITESPPAREIIFIKLWKYQNNVVLQCKSNHSLLVPSPYWYLHSELGVSKVNKTHNMKLINDKLILLEPDNYYFYGISCKMMFRNRTEVFSQVVPLLPLKDNIERGNCLDYPSKGVCSKLDKFPFRIFIPYNQHLDVLEEQIGDIIVIYKEYSMKHAITSEYLLPLLCFSQYSFCDMNETVSRWIHYDDMLNIISAIRSLETPIPQHIIHRALLIYHKNKEIIRNAIGPDSLRYSVKIFRPVVRSECLIDKGQSYIGNINVSYSGKPCLPWKSISLSLHLFPISLKDMSHNYCRNPGGLEILPYCYVKKSMIEYCNIPRCNSGFLVFNSNSAVNLIIWFSIVITFQAILTIIYFIYRYYQEIIDIYYHVRKARYFGAIINPANNSELKEIIGTRHGKWLGQYVESDSNLETTQNITTFEEFESSINNGDSVKSIVLNCRSLLSVCQKFITKNSPIIDAKAGNIPYIDIQQVKLTPIENGSQYLHYGLIETSRVREIFAKSHPNSYLKLDEHCLVVKCEESWEEISFLHKEIRYHALPSLLGIIFEDLQSPIPHSLIFDSTIICDVGEYLRNQGNKDWPKRLIDMVDILSQVCSALHFLQKKYIVHGDISLRNVVFYSNMIAESKLAVKLVSYARFRPFYADDYLMIPSEEIEDTTGRKRTGIYLPIKWMAPELIKSIIITNDYQNITLCVKNDVEISTLSQIPGTLKSDIYGFGVMAWELFHSGKKPFDQMQLGPYLNQVMENKPPCIINQDYKGSMAKFVLNCTNSDIHKRLPISSIVNTIKQISKSFDLVA